MEEIKKKQGGGTDRGGTEDRVKLIPFKQILFNLITAAETN